jgi:hypothetical protein
LLSEVIRPLPQSSDAEAILVVKHSPQEVISYLSTTLNPPTPATLLYHLPLLMVTAGPDTMAYHLTSPDCFISDALASFLSLDHSTPLPLSVKENVKCSTSLSIVFLLESPS